jgi:2-oxoglutarate dehydrogenase E1 component
MSFDINSANAEWIEELFLQYQRDPQSVSSSWRALFIQLEQLFPSFSSTKRPSILASLEEDKQLWNALRIQRLCDAYRTYGHLMAHTNPIATHSIDQPLELRLEFLGFSPEELESPFPTNHLLKDPLASLQKIIETLQQIYCGTMSIEYMGTGLEIEKWIQEKIEFSIPQHSFSMEQKRMILDQLNRSEFFESFLHMKYPGQKRFSLEGGETLIPMLEAIVESGSQMGMEELIIGMAHRGRLNVLSNILRKSHTDIFSEFEDGYIPNSFEGSGDVKYHKGFTAEVITPQQKNVRIVLCNNPSHLEAVDPLVEGMAHARQIQKKGDQKAVLALLIHGDAAIAGQGVVYETLQLYRLPGYTSGGTIHIVINNQIGFTATPEETRSTCYCTDIAHTFSAPVFHVNAEDPEGCVYTTLLALQLRQQFHCDVFIELNCYRKYGHNEGDEPAFTQPLEYQRIRTKKPIREIYRDQLIQHGILESALAESLEKEFIQGLQAALQESKDAINAPPIKKEEQATPSSPTLILSSPKTAVSSEILLAVAERMCRVPESFHIHPKLKNLLQERLAMVQSQKKSIDWGMAELLAYGSLLWEGISVRLSGQDSRRGTFSHRHGDWVDQENGAIECTLQDLRPEQGRFDLINSPLSEYAVLGFEVGYSIGHPEGLTIWEAQFGDFCNGAQVVIDQFLATTEQKWGQKCNVVLFLPHGYEGQGPEHSSGRIERFLGLAGNANMCIVYPSTPAQFFHLLRRQALASWKKPLIVFTPKGLLRHPLCTSTFSEFTEGSFQEILKDSVEKRSVKKVVFCTGKIYYDLITARDKQKDHGLMIIRLEQLYPLNTDKLAEILAEYKNTSLDYIWLQEEPQNMGAWEFMRPLLQKLLPEGAPLKYIGRERSAVSATGSYILHKQQHAALIAAVFA